jgi:hypothetical protein
MANKNFGQFILQTTLQDTDHLVGYRTTAPNGELRCTVNNLLNSPLLASKPYVAKAWISFNGVTMTINSSYNVSSIQRNTTGGTTDFGRAAGAYQINFATPMPNTNYATIGTSRDSYTTTNNAWVCFINAGDNYKTVNYIRVDSYAPTVGWQNSREVNVVVFSL